MNPARLREIEPRVVSPRESSSPLDEIYRRFAPYVAAVAMRASGRDEEIEDLVQDVFLAAARGLDHLRDPRAIKGWLATVAVRVVSRQLQMRRLRRFLHLDGVADGAHLGRHLIDRAASPVDRLQLVAIYRLLDELPTNDRLAWSLHYLEGETLDAVAQLCGCSCATAKRRIARVQRRVQDRFESRFEHA